MYKGVRIPMDRLDDTVTVEVVRRVLQPDRLTGMLQAFVETSASRDAEARERLSRMRQQHKEAEAGVSRLLQLLEQGVMDAGDASLRERLVALRFQRDELGRDIAEMNRRLGAAEPLLREEKVEKAAALLKEKLEAGPVEFRRSYARLIMNEVAVTDREIRISGSKEALARYTGQAENSDSPKVLSFIREWRTRQDSNL